MKGSFDGQRDSLKPLNLLVVSLLGDPASWMNASITR